jgi:ribosomal protein L12E/L44/L45/RPP1/RPP2
MLRSSGDANDKIVNELISKKFEDAIAEKKLRRDAPAAAAAAAAAAAEAPFTKSKEAQLEALKRRGRRASILTSSQGAYEPLGIPG